MIRDALKKHLEQDSDREAIARAYQNIADCEQEIENLQRDLREGIVPEIVRPSRYTQIAQLMSNIETHWAIINDDVTRREKLKHERGLFTELLQWYDDILAVKESEKELSLEAKHRFFKFIGLRVILGKGNGQPGGRHGG